jgi:predicted transcriptional regulator
MTPPLMEFDIALLRRILHEYGFAFVRPRDVGGYDARKGSLHAQRLAQLARRGLLARQRVNRADARRPHYAYAITRAGALAVAQHEGDASAA